MNVNTITLGVLREAHHDYLLVPFFQRRYVWTLPNWEEMYAALKEPETPFLGTIILKLNTESTEYPDGSYVIDGQQRLTTLSLMFKALYDCLTIKHNINKEGQIPTGILSHILQNKRNGDEFGKDSSVKLVQSLLENELFEHIIMENIKYLDGEILYTNKYDKIDLTIEDSEEELMVECYAYFRQEFDKLTEIELREFYSKITSNKYFCMVEIQLSSQEENEQAIFDTINRAGVRLSISDIIKNNIFSRYSDCSKKNGKTLEDIRDYYREKWEKHFLAQKNESSLWDEKLTFGNNQRTNLDFLLYCVALNCWTDEKNLFDNLANIYKRKISNMDLAQIENLIEQINDYRKEYYEKIITVQSRYNIDMPFEYKDWVNRLMLVLEVCGVKMFHPFVLKRLVELSKTDDDKTIEKIKEEFHVIETFVVRRRLSSKGTHDYTEKCIKMLNDNNVKILLNELQGKDITGATYDSKIQDSNVIEYISNIKTNNAKLILFIIELYKNSSATSANPSYKYIYELEHIMPQKWKENWMNVALKKEDGSDWKDDNGNTISANSIDGAKIRDSHVCSIGNMTLLTKKLNIEISNGSFSEKMEGKIDKKGNKKPGIKESSAGSQLCITNEIVKEYDGGDKIWDEQHIKNREKILGNYIVELWPSAYDLTVLDIK